MYYGACEYIGNTPSGLPVFEYRSVCNGVWWTVGGNKVTQRPYVKKGAFI